MQAIILSPVVLLVLVTGVSAHAVGSLGSSFDFVLAAIMISLALLFGLFAWRVGSRLFQALSTMVMLALLIFGAGPALAADDTIVQLAPWVTLIKPYLDAMVMALINFVIVPLVGWAVWRITGIQIDKRYSDQLTKLLTNSASGLVATGAAMISPKGVDVHSAILKAEADKLIAFAPNAVKWFGLTPEDVANRIVQKIPQLPIAAGAAALPAAG